MPHNGPTQMMQFYLPLREAFPMSMPSPPTFGHGYENGHAAFINTPAQPISKRYPTITLLAQERFTPSFEAEQPATTGGTPKCKALAFVERKLENQESQAKAEREKATRDKYESGMLRYSNSILAQFATIPRRSYFWKPEGPIPDSCRHMLKDKKIWTPWSQPRVKQSDAAKFEAVSIINKTRWVKENSGTIDEGIIKDKERFYTMEDETRGHYGAFHVHISDVTSVELFSFKGRGVLSLKAYEDGIFFTIMARPGWKNFNTSASAYQHVHTGIRMLSLDTKADVRRSLSTLRSVVRALWRVPPRWNFQLHLLEQLQRQVGDPVPEWLFIELFRGHNAQNSAHIASVLGLHKIDIRKTTARIERALDDLLVNMGNPQAHEYRAELLASNIKAEFQYLQQKLGFGYILENGLIEARFDEALGPMQVLVTRLVDVYFPQETIHYTFDKDGEEDDEWCVQGNSWMMPPDEMPESIHREWKAVVSMPSWREPRAWWRGKY
ncbi:hypothetical protein BJ508DRAFT_348054 [Ascobolus immersus RN42]|uniref:Uncharacterized protein n=1 Tax=Ascobolus immersus RN42 TaxID=1160509 RepID=A0A3N4I4H8_ASCIM|nr:hypothetical protein BJ508DRAFT_348054 [Ascobolus immersus RN42]